MLNLKNLERKARKNLFFIKYQQKTSKLDLNSLSQATKDIAWDVV